MLLPKIRSSLPSPLRSASAMALALLPEPNVRAAWNVPSPLPSSTPTFSKLATTTSSRPSPFTSPNAMDVAHVPPVKYIDEYLNFPLPVLKTTPTPLPEQYSYPLQAQGSTISKSGRPSPFTSPTATGPGMVPPVGKSLARPKSELASRLDSANKSKKARLPTRKATTLLDIYPPPQSYR